MSVLDHALHLPIQVAFQLIAQESLPSAWEAHHDDDQLVLDSTSTSLRAGFVDDRLLVCWVFVNCLEVLIVIIALKFIVHRQVEILEVDHWQLPAVLPCGFCSLAGRRAPLDQLATPEFPATSKSISTVVQ